ncbi:hypothetical protein K493DRAFT_307587 [Basidiobolus meristosporus CBS 931.73]|uniref:Thyroglobulin type-1 domain-containing protein n=1 Tax=Basidiobolus meristosporus CBS 931.73 TaxID=1314790 RepID=A0A1Y1XCP7_9FUNG|nr:hypothetical protein K493DRAFT_307587 [Basidiobolus meristosporus CBS 931.73]|eukprot:ORX83561.1 hypothetical protein K493DRAFT_307587 [Basidiobolus meristosporus CBS 931.73]
MVSTRRPTKDSRNMKVKAVSTVSFALLAPVWASDLPPKTETFQAGSINTIHGLTSTLSHGAAVTTLAQRCNDGQVNCMPDNHHRYKKCINGYWVVFDCPTQYKPIKQQFVCVSSGTGEAQCELPMKASALKTGMIAATSLSVHRSAETSQAVETMGCSPSTYNGKCLSKDRYLTCYKGNVAEAACPSGYECQMINSKPSCQQIPVTYTPIQCDPSVPWSCLDKKTMQHCTSFGTAQIKACSGNQICEDKLGCIVPGTEKKYKPLSGACDTPFQWACSSLDAAAWCLEGEWRIMLCPSGSSCKEGKACVQNQIENSNVNVPSVTPSTSTPDTTEPATPSIDIVQSVVLQTKVVTRMVAESTAVVTISKKSNCPAEYECVLPGQGRQFKKCINGEMVPFNCQDTSICVDWVSWSGQWEGIECILQIAGNQTPHPTLDSSITHSSTSVRSDKADTDTSTHSTNSDKSGTATTTNTRNSDESDTGVSILKGSSDHLGTVTPSHISSSDKSEAAMSIPSKSFTPESKSMSYVPVKPECQKSTCESERRTGVVNACINGVIKKYSCGGNQVCLMISNGPACAGAPPSGNSIMSDSKAATPPAATGKKPIRGIS